MMDDESTSFIFIESASLNKYLQKKKYQKRGQRSERPVDSVYDSKIDSDKLCTNVKNSTAASPSGHAESSLFDESI